MYSLWSEDLPKGMYQAYLLFSVAAYCHVWFWPSKICFVMRRSLKADKSVLQTMNHVGRRLFKCVNQPKMLDFLLQGMCIKGEVNSGNWNFGQFFIQKTLYIKKVRFWSSGKLSHSCQSAPCSPVYCSNMIVLSWLASWFREQDK